MSKHQPLPRPVAIVSISLYVLAVIALALGIYLGISFLSATAALDTMQIMFGAPQLLPLIGLIRSGLMSIGTIILISGVAVGALLLATGISMRRTAALTQRMARLEAALERAGIAIDTENSHERRPSPVAAEVR